MKKQNMTAMMIIIGAMFTLSVLPVAELPGLKYDRLVYRSVNPVICENTQIA